MRKILATVALLAISAGGFAQSGQTCTINGSAPFSSDGDTVMLMSMGQRQMNTIFQDVVSNHTFMLQENVQVAGLRTVVAIKNGQPASFASVVLSPGASISVELGKGIDSKAKITGDRSNDIIQEEEAYETAEAMRHQDFIYGYQDTTLDIVTRFYCKQKLDSLSLAIQQRRINVIINNMPLPVCSFLLQQWGSDMSGEQVQQILDAMGRKMPNDPVYKAIIAQQKAQAEAEAATEVGRQFVEIAMLDTRGSMVRLSDVVKQNKYTLVDFWASWCRPCLAELPNVKRVYEKYHPKGLEIYGVSLDENQINWQNAIERLDMKWIHVSDLKGWQSAGAKSYNIHGIPATVLIDQSGKIIAKNLRGDELEAKMAQLLK
ncbi:MAG: TlpA family protein disulfide reductase [Bacteroidales bacterium]|nr:TlpA family protein disulfide reductase [Bacteroidales bacterium]